MRPEMRKALNNFMKYMNDRQGELIPGFFDPFNEDIVNYVTNLDYQKIAPAFGDRSTEVAGLIAEDMVAYNRAYLDRWFQPDYLLKQAIFNTGGHALPVGWLSLVAQTGVDLSNDLADARLEVLQRWQQTLEDLGASEERQDDFLAHIREMLYNASDLNAVETIQLMTCGCNGFSVYDHKQYYEAVGYGAGTLADLKKRYAESEPKRPTPARPCMSYIPVWDPDITPDDKEAEAASYLIDKIPSYEWSAAVPFFQLEIQTPSGVVRLGRDLAGAEAPLVLSALAPEEFLGAQNYASSFSQGLPSLAADDAETVDATKPPTQPRPVVGMEAFTMPQSLVPVGHPNEAFRSYSGNASIDRTRPFMTVTSFTAKVNPTRGAMSQQSADLTLVLHDRRRLPQIEALVKPGVYNKTKIRIEYGWSHPGSAEIEVEGYGKSADATVVGGNVYAELINAQRQAAVFTVSASSYSFTNDGQVNISLKLVTAGIQSLNEVDSSTTGTLMLGDEAVQLAFEALQEARNLGAGALAKPGIADMTGMTLIKTLSLTGTGNFLDKESSKQIDEFIKEAKAANAGGGAPELTKLTSALDGLKTAVTKANSKMNTDLTNKVEFMKGKAYKNQAPYTVVPAALGATDKGMDPVYNKQIFKNIEDSTTTVPLGLVLHLFLTLPLAAQGIYDEIQLLTYTANAHAGKSSFLNLGALPIDLSGLAPNAGFEKLLKAKYTEWGGQFPVARMINFLKENFIDPHFATCYGLVDRSDLKYDSDKKAVVPKDGASPGDQQAAIDKKLREYTYGSDTEGTPFLPRPTKFTPIRLRVNFEVLPVDARDLIKTNSIASLELPPDALTAKRNILRIHVFDENQSPSAGLLTILRGFRKEQGLIVAPDSRDPVQIGANPFLLAGLAPQTQAGDPNFYLQSLAEADILEQIPLSSQPADPAVIEELQGQLDQFTADIEAFENDPATSRLDADDIALLKETEIPRLEKTIADGGVEAEGYAYRLKANAGQLIDFVSKGFPTIRYGDETSPIRSLTVQANTNSKQATIQMLQAASSQKDGGNSEPYRGLPMRVFPAQMSAELMGSTGVKFMQKFFVNMNTATTIDNLYGVAGIEHKLTPNDFSTTVKLIGLEAYGSFYGLADDFTTARIGVEQLIKDQQAYNEEKAAAAAAAAATARQRSAAAAPLTGVEEWLQNQWISYALMARAMTGWLSWYLWDRSNGEIGQYDGDRWTRTSNATFRYRIQTALYQELTYNVDQFMIRARMGTDPTGADKTTAQWWGDPGQRQVMANWWAGWGLIPTRDVVWTRGDQSARSTNDPDYGAWDAFGTATDELSLPNNVYSSCVGTPNFAASIAETWWSGKSAQLKSTSGVNVGSPPEENPWEYYKREEIRIYQKKYDKAKAAAETDPSNSALQAEADSWAAYLEFYGVSV